MWRRKIVIRVTLFVFFLVNSHSTVLVIHERKSRVRLNSQFIWLRWEHFFDIKHDPCDALRQIIEFSRLTLSLSLWSDIIWRCAHPADDDSAVPCGIYTRMGKRKNVLCSILCCRVEFTLSGIESFILLCGYSRLCAASALFWAFHPALRLTFSHFWSRLGSDSLHKFCVWCSNCRWSVMDSVFLVMNYCDSGKIFVFWIDKIQVILQNICSKFSSITRSRGLTPSIIPQHCCAVLLKRRETETHSRLVQKSSLDSSGRFFFSFLSSFFPSSPSSQLEHIIVNTMTCSESERHSWKKEAKKEEFIRSKRWRAA